MKQTVSQYDFIDAFRKMERYEQFGYDALLALFEYLENFEEDTGEEIELDVISICCDYSAYDSALEAVQELTGEELESEEDAIEYLEQRKTVIQHNSGIVIQDF